MRSTFVPVLTGAVFLAAVLTGCVVAPYDDGPYDDGTYYSGTYYSGTYYSGRYYGFNAISAMPTNLYGPGDNFDLQTSHVLPALIHKFHLAKMRADAAVPVWGSGKPRREFLYVDDLADALCFLMEKYDSPEIVNIGVGNDVSIAELAGIVSEITGFSGTTRCIMAYTYCSKAAQKRRKILRIWSW